MSTGKAICKKCGAKLKLEVCGECLEGYAPRTCTECHGDILIEYLPVPEEGSQSEETK